MPTLLLCIFMPKIDKFQNWCIFSWKKWLWLIGFALVYCVGVNERENPKSRMKMFQSNIYYFTSIKVYIVSIEEIYGVLSLSMEFYLCLWNSIFVYGVLSMSMEFYVCPWSSIFVFGVLSLSMEFYLCLRDSIFVYGVLSLYMEFYLCIWKASSCFIILLL